MSERGSEINLGNAVGLHPNPRLPLLQLPFQNCISPTMLSPRLVEALTIVNSASDTELQFLQTDAIGLVGRLAKLPFVRLLASDDLPRRLHLLTTRSPDASTHIRQV